ncbi:hypothetical protein, unlikely [Trypanosoma congolense IL3000]|uniref:Uncharacterized protein n=1 Tax=Trypanosoma congolense (strain IL3000) TaxID=1068625 RepID=F9WI00_TRYCI|nr:hypothetical protein, unlikely [Trypanosoma congolense IL3000]
MQKNSSNSEITTKNTLFGTKKKTKKIFFCIFLQNLKKLLFPPGSKKQFKQRKNHQKTTFRPKKQKNEKKYFFCLFLRKFCKNCYFPPERKKTVQTAKITPKNPLFRTKKQKNRKKFFFSFFLPKFL